MRNWIAAFTLVAGLTGLGAAAMAGAYDGDWIGQVPPISTCRDQSVMNITVAGDTLMGQIHNPGNVRAITGKIDADGNASFTVAPNFGGTMKFTADRFEGNWFNGNCIRHVLGDHAPNPDQTAALIAKRKQAQALYDSLSAKAASGDRNVDFTALRAAYPFTTQWDVFSNKTGPLMTEAVAEAKGGDCAAALDKLDQVLKIDFTIILAHRTRGDCLSGDAARTETRIADGLEDSLTDKGDGTSEKTAYPTMTMREENDILVYKHIALKTRQIELRGSDGRFYDVVHGVSLWDGVQLRDVYFDVTAQVEARNSRMALARTVAAQLP